MVTGRTHFNRREIGDRLGEGLALVNLGYVFGFMGDDTGAKDYSEEALRISREIGNRRVEAIALINSR